jgi:hypothetical protein
MHCHPPLPAGAAPLFHLLSGEESPTPPYASRSPSPAPPPHPTQSHTTLTTRYRYLLELLPTLTYRPVTTRTPSTPPFPLRPPHHHHHPSQFCTWLVVHTAQATENTFPPNTQIAHLFLPLLLLLAPLPTPKPRPPFLFPAVLHLASRPRCPRHQECLRGSRHQHTTSPCTPTLDPPGPLGLNPSHPHLNPSHPPHLSFAPGWSSAPL